jgi:hypothetical protein
MARRRGHLLQERAPCEQRSPAAIRFLSQSLEKHSPARQPTLTQVHIEIVFQNLSPSVLRSSRESFPPGSLPHETDIGGALWTR